MRVFSDCCFSCLSLGTCDAHIFISSHDRSSTLCSASTHVHRSTTCCLVGRIVPFLRSSPSPKGPQLFWVWPPPSISGGVGVVVVMVVVVVVGLDSPKPPCARPPDAGLPPDRPPRPPPPDRPKFRVFFFPSPAPIFVLSLSLGVFSLNFGGVFEGRGPQTCTFRLSGCRVKPRRLWGRTVFDERSEKGNKQVIFATQGPRGERALLGGGREGTPHRLGIAGREGRGGGGGRREAANHIEPWTGLKVLRSVDDTKPIIRHSFLDEFCRGTCCCFSS